MQRVSCSPEKGKNKSDLSVQADILCKIPCKGLKDQSKLLCNSTVKYKYNRSAGKVLLKLVMSGNFLEFPYQIQKAS